MKIRLFIFIECMLLIMALVSLVSEPPFLISLIIFGSVMALRSKWNSTFLKILTVISLVPLVATVLSNIYMWIAIILAVLALVFFARKPKKDQNFDVVETYFDDTCRAGMEKYKLTSGQENNDEVYRFDDINILKFVSDDVIDLEYTDFRQDDNVIVIRKLMGNTKILIPKDLAVSVDFITVNGTADVCGQKTIVARERMKYYSDNIETANKKLRIYVDSVFGDLTVIKL